MFIVMEQKNANGKQIILVSLELVEQLLQLMILTLRKNVKIIYLNVLLRMVRDVLKRQLALLQLQNQHAHQKIYVFGIMVDVEIKDA